MRARAVLSWLLWLCLATNSAGRVAHAQARTHAPSSHQAEPEVFMLPQLRLPAGVALREQVLSSTFGDLKASARGRGFRLGALFVASATLIGFGTAYLRKVGGLLLPLGAIGLGRGIVALTVSANPRVPADIYLSLPMTTAEQARTRIRYGEHALAELARFERIARICDGSLAMLASGSYVPLSWYIAHRRDPSYRFDDDSFNYALLALSVINAASALVTALREAPIEQRQREYRELVNKLEKQSPGQLEKLVDSLSLSVSGSRQRLELSAGVRF